MVLHPCSDEKGNPVTIEFPSAPTPLFAWLDPGQSATVVPTGPMPHELNKVPFRPWRRPPSDRREWNRLAEEMCFAELLFHPPVGKAPAAGAVIVEPDGRVWLVSPTNQHGGAQATFPKGAVTGLSLAATALKEVFEKTGLQIELMDHLLDVERTTSYTRYYLARRLGGTPVAMGWRSQAVHLVPLELVKDRLNLPVDHPIFGKLMEVWGAWAGHYREPAECHPSRTRRQSPKSLQTPPPPQQDESAAKYAKQDADAIAALANVAEDEKNPAKAIQHYKHLAVVFHHQGKPGLAKHFYRQVKDSEKQATEVQNGSGSGSLFDASGFGHPPARILRNGMSKDAPIYEVQAKFMGHLILELEAACLRAYEFKARQDIRWGDHLSPAPWDLPEYRRFIEGGPACGFVVEDCPPEDWLDLDDINQEPPRRVSSLRPHEVRLYLHSLNRSEKWADGYSSPVFEALASGALQAVAKRLLEDESLYEPD